MTAGGGMSDLERKMVEDNLVETFKKNKLEISKAINTPSPFLEILRDHSVISEEMYQCAQKKYQKLVPICKGSICTYSILMQLEKKFSSKILAALFHPTNLQEYPLLVQIQKQFRDEPLDESTSEVNMGSPLQRSSLDESAWIISTPQSSVQEPLDESTSEANMGSPLQRSSLDESAWIVSTPQSSVQVPLDQSTPESNVSSPVQRSSLDESISARDVQVPLNQSTPESNVGSPVQRSSLDESTSVSDVQVPLDQSTPESNVGSPVQRSSLDESTSVSDVQVPPDQSPPESNAGSPVQRSSLDESTSVRDVQEASNNNKPLRVGRIRNRGATLRVHWVTKKVSRKARGPKINYNLPELPVTCRKAKGTLHKEKMKNGSSEKCIEMADGRWLTPREFEIEGGRELTKNWKKSICCGWHTLHYLILKKILPCPPRRYGRTTKDFATHQTRRQPKVQKRTPECQAPLAQNASLPQPKRRCFQRRKVPGRTCLSRSQLPGRRQVVSLANRPKYRAQLQAREWIHVACRMGTGRLYKNRFATVYQGKCILTESGWYTPLEFLAKDPEIDITTWTHSIRSGGLTLQTLIENDILKLHTSDCSCIICHEEDPFPENNDECFMCVDGGKLFCCDSCPKSFHKDCHIPSVSPESAEWNCTFCIIRKNKEKEDPENSHCWQEFEVLKQRMYPVQQLKCEYLLMRMYCCSESFLFIKDPCRYKVYSQRVREPMWLDQVKERLSDETYNTVEGFVLDMRLIFYNCKKFNKDNQFGHLGAKLEAKFERDFKEVFDIKEADEVDQPIFP